MKNLIWVGFVLSFTVQSLCRDLVSITAKPGQNVNLPCGAAGNGKVSVIMLTRDNLQPDCVLLYRNDKFDKEQQNPQYLGRTELQSLTSTDGEVNVSLNNVTEKDSGEYECRVKTEIKSNTRRKRAALESTFILLSVAAAQSDADPPPSPPPGQGHGGLVVGLMVVLIVLVAFAALAVFVWKKRNVSSSQDETVESLKV